MAKINPSTLRVGSDAISILLGFVVGYYAFTSRSSTVDPEKERAQGIPAVQSQKNGLSRKNPAGETPSDKVGRGVLPPPAAGSMSSRIMAQLRSSEPIGSRQTLFLPKEAVKRYQWQLGDVGLTYAMSRETKTALSISDPAAKSLETEINRFLLSVRQTELKNVQVLENEGNSVLLYIPPNISIEEPLNRLNAATKTILGEQTAELFYPRLLSKVDMVTSLLKGEQRFIGVKLVEGGTGVEVAVSSTRDDVSTWRNYIPDTLSHLVKIGEENLRKK